MVRIGYIDERTWQNTFRQFFKNDFDIVLFDINEKTDVDSLTDDIFERDIDMLVIDFRLESANFNGDTLVDKIQERNLYYPMIILTSYESEAIEHLANANLVNGKDMLDGDNPKPGILKQKMLKIAGDYKRKVSESERQLEFLEKKRVKEGLSPNEEDLYVELNNFLDKTVAAKKHLSRTFYSEDTNKKLDDLIGKMEHLLEMIPGDE
ncbi:hypothetical protein QUF72_14400 [Desulfobacterales bacterium HSG2]|nr:hypothetical protein [Desulfobacterales bacterium HSG2]